MIGLEELGFEKMVAGSIDARLQTPEESSRFREVRGSSKGRRGAWVEAVKRFEGRDA